jgi:subtilisin family serine protease
VKTKYLLSLPILLLTVFTNVALCKVGAPKAPTAVDGQFIVTTNDSFVEFARSLESNGFRYVEKLPFGYHLVRQDREMTADFASVKLHALGAQNVQPNFVKRIAGERTALTAMAQPEQWALDNPKTGIDIHAKNAWKFLSAIPSANRAIRVATIDSGIDLQSKEFEGRIDFSKSYNFVGGNTNIQDYLGHGTHVAGIIGASHAPTSRILGINPNVEFVILKAFTMYGISTTATLLKALNATLGADVRIVNASYASTQFDQAEFDGVSRLQKAGILFVAAAGNDGRDTDLKPNYPADFDLSNVVSVGASDRLDKPGSFSNYGASSVDVFAPGVDILSTVVHVSYINRQKVFALSMNDSNSTDWNSQASRGSLRQTDPWIFDRCEAGTGQCLSFRTPQDYTPSLKTDFFNLKYLKTLKANPEKRYSVQTTTRFNFPALNWEHLTYGSLLSGGTEFWMMPAGFVEGVSNGWVEKDFDISKPGLFSSGTTAWDEIHLGYSAGFSSMADYPQYKNAQMFISKFDVTTEDPAATPAIESYNGTSMAAPHVVGIASWMLAKDPSMKPEDVRAILNTSCDRVATLANKAICGGRVNMLEAVRH